MELITFSLLIADQSMSISNLLLPPLSLPPLFPPSVLLLICSLCPGLKEITGVLAIIDPSSREKLPSWQPPASSLRSLTPRVEGVIAKGGVVRLRQACLWRQKSPKPCSVAFSKEGGGSTIESDLFLNYFCLSLEQICSCLKSLCGWGRSVWGEEKVTERKKREKEGKRWSSTSPLTPVPVCTSWMAYHGAWCFPATGSWTGSWPHAWPPRWRSASAPRTPAPSSPCVSWSLHPFTCCSSLPPCLLPFWASSSGLPCRLFASPTCTPTAG